MNLAHPAVQRLLGLAHALEARAESLASPPNPIPAYQRLKETVALEHTSTASELRRIAETIGEPPAPSSDITSIVLDHCHAVADEHARLLELVQDFVWLTGGEPEDCERLAAEYGVETDPDDADYHRNIELELHAAGVALIAECTCRTPVEPDAPQVAGCPFATGAMG